MAIEDKGVVHDVQPDSAVDSELGEIKDVVINQKADVGLRFLAQSGPVEFTNLEVKQVRWKIDLFFLPIVRPSESADDV